MTNTIPHWRRIALNSYIYEGKPLYCVTDTRYNRTLYQGGSWEVARRVHARAIDALEKIDAYNAAARGCSRE